MVSERAHLRDQPSKDEIRRGARALGFWEKLCEYLWDGITDDATFDEVMAKMEKLKEAARVQAQHSDLVSSALETVRDVLGATPGDENATDAARRVVKERDELKAERDKYRAMWKQLHRAQGEDLDAKEQFKELLGALGLAHFDRNTISSALEATRKRDARLCIERDEAWAAHGAAEKRYQEVTDKVQALELKLLEVRKAVG